jgi:gliding motility-associated-like protein
MLRIKFNQLGKFVLNIIFFFISYTICCQQNLVPNGSFEILSACPVGADIDKAVGWFSPNQATPDLFNGCADLSTNLSVPLNGFGFQYAQEGIGYAGIVPYSYSGTNNNYREYLEIKLLNSLNENALYYISFYMNLANVSPLATNNMGYGFCQDTTGQYLQSVISPIVSNSNSNINNDTVNWIKVEGYHLGTGIEDYFIIGNFHNDAETDTLSTGMPFTDVYYYIDNVSVVETSIGLENIFTPNNDGINDIAFKNSLLKEFKVDILNRWGGVVNSVNLSEGWDGRTMHGEEATEGVYFFVIGLESNKQKFIKTGFIQLIR